MNSEGKSLPIFLDRLVQFPDSTSYELLDPLTNYRSCHYGRPLEARMVFLARRSMPPGSDEQFVAKVKVQLPADGQEPEQGPSTATAHELKALNMFREAECRCAPHLVAFKSVPQDKRGPLPGGYISFTIMTKMPGMPLFGSYWNMPTSDREQVIQHSVQALQSIYALGIEPIDRGLRNIIWDTESKKCSIIDFEMWNEAAEPFADETKELQGWGLVRRPPPRDWWTEWNMQNR